MKTINAWQVWIVQNKKNINVMHQLNVRQPMNKKYNKSKL